jgi:hypothetical protein
MTISSIYFFHQFQAKFYGYLRKKVEGRDEREKREI